MPSRYFWCTTRAARSQLSSAVPSFGSMVSPNGKSRSMIGRSASPTVALSEW